MVLLLKVFNRTSKKSDDASFVNHGRNLPWTEVCVKGGNRSTSKTSVTADQAKAL